MEIYENTAKKYKDANKEKIENEAYETFRKQIEQWFGSKNI